MNSYTYHQNDRYNRGGLLRHSPQFSASSLGSPYSRTHSGGRGYISSEAGSPHFQQQEYFPENAYEAYAYPDKLPLDEPSEDVKQHALSQNRRFAGRAPGYVTSIDTTPSHQMPHSALTSADGLMGQPMYDNFAQYSPDGLHPHLPNGYAPNGPYDDLYAGSEWSSDSDTSLRGARNRRHHRHQPYPGQRRMTDLGAEVFNGVAWIAEEDYITDANTMYNQYYPSRY